MIFMQKIPTCLTTKIFGAMCGLILTALLCMPTLAHAAGSTPTFKVAAFSKKNNPLLKPVKQKGTVGIIPYYQIKGKTYVFLGQELSGGKREAAATFSDFGG